MKNTTIEWTDRTWNPTKGCSKVSAGCKNCYAIRMAARLEAMGHPAYQNVTKRKNGKLNWTGKVNIDQKTITAPLSWKQPSKIFVNSMSDLFHENIDETVLQEIWSVMSKADHHLFKIFTKRPEVMLEKLADQTKFPLLPNVWLGVSVENKNQISRLDILRQIPATIRFVSFEPLLSSVVQCNLDQIDWVIVGGESGPKARVVREKWVLEILDLCTSFNSAFFFKQWGGVNKKTSGRMLNHQEFNEFPI